MSGQAKKKTTHKQQLVYNIKIYLRVLQTEKTTTTIGHTPGKRKCLYTIKQNNKTIIIPNCESHNQIRDL